MSVHVCVGLGLPVACEWPKQEWAIWRGAAVGAAAAKPCVRYTFHVFSCCHFPLLPATHIMMFRSKLAPLLARLVAGVVSDLEALAQRLQSNERLLRREVADYKKDPSAGATQGMCSIKVSTRPRCGMKQHKGVAGSRAFGCDGETWLQHSGLTGTSNVLLVLSCSCVAVPGNRSRRSAVR